MPNTELTPAQKNLADTIWETGAFKVGAFKLKLHQKNPEAPLSPYYISMREKDVLPDTFERLTNSLANAIHEQTEHLTHDINFVLGIPKAGDPIADAYNLLTDTPVLRMDKIESTEGRRISSVIHGDFKEGDLILGVDDLITEADTKIEFIEGVRANKLVLVHLAVGLDREQGGLKRLEGAGESVSAVLGVSRLLEYYLGNTNLNQATFDDITTYIANSKLK